MPELPEVETMVRDLRPRVTGRMISRVEVAFAGTIAWPDAAAFANRAGGTRIGDISRRGKFGILHLSSGDVLAIHRGMTGTLLHTNAFDPMESHIRLVFSLDDGTELRFRDQRKFGRAYLMDGSGRERPWPWAALGPEPLNGAFTASRLSRNLQGRTGLIKPLLLGQRIVAGLGNIYVDEALHLARIHPLRRAHTLSTAEVRRLHRSIREVLSSAIEGRGTTFSSYADLEGRAGGYQDSLQVFRQTGAACPRCGKAIVRLVVGGRGTHVCPRCQRL